jgi:hypothetical protein
MPKKGKTNSSLKSWVSFVKKVQKEENITYPEAMKRASVRKSEWKRGGGESNGDSSSSSSMGESSSPASESINMGYTNSSGGGRKKTKKVKKSRKSRKSRKTRKSRKSKKN